MVVKSKHRKSKEVVATFQISLEAARVNAKFSQKDVARMMNVNVATISNWENGKTSLSADQFKTLCNIYGCPMDIIFLRGVSL